VLWRPLWKQVLGSEGREKEVVMRPIGLRCLARAIGLVLAISVRGASAAEQTPRIPPPISAPPLIAPTMPRVTFPQPDRDRLQLPERRSGGAVTSPVPQTVGDSTQGVQGSWIRISADHTGIAWRVIFPGVYAAEVCHLTVASPDPVVLAIMPGCGNLVTPPGSIIPTWYSFGETIAEANACGWIPAGRFGGMTFPTLLGRPGEAGRTITIWSKIDTTVAPAEPGYHAGFQLSVYTAE
jgi:hypothetical protein